MDITHFALLDWVERDLMILHDLPMNDICVDTFTKPLGKQLFYHHFDTIMGRRILAYIMNKSNTLSVACFTDSRSTKHGGYHRCTYVAVRIVTNAPYVGPFLWSLLST